MDQFKPAAGKSRTRQIKDWLRHELNLPEEFSIIVTELKCSEPGCPPIETVVAVLGPDSKQYQQKVHMPIEKVTEADIKEIGNRLGREMKNETSKTTSEACDDDHHG